MAEQQTGLEQTLERMKHEVMLKLTPEGGRVMVDSADLDRVDQCRLEIKCWYSPELFSADVTIGSEEHSRVKRYEDEDEDGDEDDQESKPVEMETGWRLGDFPVMLTIYRVDETWLRGSADKNGGKPVLGHFIYYPRKKDVSANRDKRPTATAWMAFGADNFELVRSRLLDFKRYDFEIGLTVAFPQGSVESHDIMGQHVKWDGEGTLAVLGGVVVWRREDWSPDYYRKERLFEKKTPQAELPYDPPREHLESMEFSRRIVGALGSLTTPLWITVGLLGVLAIKLW